MPKRLHKLTALMNRELEVLELGSKIQDQVQSEMDRTSASTCCGNNSRPSRTSWENRRDPS